MNIFIPGRRNTTPLRHPFLMWIGPTDQPLVWYDDQLRQKISHEGWGKQLLDLRKPDGHWGQAFYQPKWISTHYTLLDLKHLAIDPKNIKIRSSIQMVLDTEKGPDGGIKPIGQFQQSDVCINGMFLNYACYFGADETQISHRFSAQSEDA